MIGVSVRHDDGRVGTIKMVHVVDQGIVDENDDPCCAWFFLVMTTGNPETRGHLAVWRDDEVTVI